MLAKVISKDIFMKLLIILVRILGCGWASGRESSDASYKSHHMRGILVENGLNGLNIKKNCAFVNFVDF